MNTHLRKVLSARHNGGNISGPGENEEGKLDSDVVSEVVVELDENAVMEQREQQQGTYCLKTFDKFSKKYYLTHL